MSGQEVHLEFLLSRRVVDANGDVAGWIEEVHALRNREETVVEEFILGSGGLIERLSMPTLNLLRIASTKRSLSVSWELLDISDPYRPRLKCTIAELKSSAMGQMP